MFVSFEKISFAFLSFSFWCWRSNPKPCTCDTVLSHWDAFSPFGGTFLMIFLKGHWKTMCAENACFTWPSARPQSNVAS